MAHTTNRSDCTGMQPAAFHDRSVHFDFALRVQGRTETGIEDRIVLQQADRGFNRIKRTAAFLEDGNTGIDRAQTTDLCGSTLSTRIVCAPP